VTYEEWSPVVDALWEKYGPRIEALLQRIADELKSAGYRLYADPESGSNVFDYSDDESALGIGSEYDAKCEPIGEDFGWEAYLIEERVRDGGDGTGVSFLLSGSYGGGKILTSWAPGNYTPAWVVDALDPEAVEQRWWEFSQSILADPHSFVERLKEVGIEPTGGAHDQAPS